MPDIELQDAMHDTGYSARAHIRSVMFFPASGSAAQRELFWKAQYREALIADLADHFDHRNSTVPVTREQVDVLVHAPAPAALLKAREETTIRRSGFIAANCLRFLIRAALACKAKPDLAWLLQVQVWEEHLKTIFYRNARDLSNETAALRDLLKKNPPQNRQLTDIRRDFIPVAHFWAARYDDGGNGSEPRTKAQFMDFLARAEGHRELAEELGIYRIAWQGDSPAKPVGIAREVEVQELVGQRSLAHNAPRASKTVTWGGKEVELPITQLDDSFPVPTGRTWTETAFELTPIRPHFEPLREADIAKLAKKFA